MGKIVLIKEGQSNQLLEKINNKYLLNYGNIQNTLFAIHVAK